MTQDDSTSRELVISDEVRQKFGPLIELMLQSESMNNEERQYWINILPVMTQEQLKTLENILTNEKNQLAAIDAKYGKSKNAEEAKADSKEFEKNRRAKLENIQSKEQAFEEKDKEHEEDILKKIQEF